MREIKKVRINGHHYDLAYYDKSNIRKDECYGECQKHRNQILIAPNLNKSVEKETVIHEMLHAIWSEYSLDNFFPEEQEEVLVTTLAKGIHSVLENNPKLMNYLKEK